MLEDSIFDNSLSFDKKAITLFRYQVENNKVYKEYCELINCRANDVNSIEQIPFLPISTFKTHTVISGNFEPQTHFESSGTTGSVSSKHNIKDLSLYKKSFTQGFNSFYGNVSDYCIIGLLPSYLERSGSSLVFMVNEFIKLSNHSQSGFFLHNTEELNELLNELNIKKEKVLLIGVSFALLDFAEKHQVQPNENLVVMETGGMKGRRKELIREELHCILKEAFKLSNIHSEYGMTELLSQAYSKGDGKFKCPPWMKILIRNQDDPFSYLSTEKVGAINVIDLANIHSCAFIQTDDLGKLYTDNSFEVLGRFDASDVRGCNLMIT